MQRPSITMLLVMVSILAVDVSTSAAQVMRWGGEHELPVEVEGTANVVRIDAGNASGYALTSLGSVLSWGNGKYGALGAGSSKSFESAIQVRLPAGVKTVSLGEAERSGFAVTSTGHVFAWGMNKHGDLCLGEEGENETKVTMPQEVPGVTNAVAVQGAKNHVLIVLANGTVETCGWGPEGQLGLGKGVREVTSPTPVPGLEHIVEVSAGPQASAARTTSGELFVFGSNQEGQVAQVKSTHQLYTPTRLRLPGPVTSVSVGGGTPLSHTEVLIGGVPYCWGSDVAGECGDGSEEPNYTPVVASELAMLGPLRAVIAAGLSTIALTKEGNVYTVGEEGELGIEGGEPSLSPQFVEGGVVEISGTAHDHLDRH
jgi:alpha-tubulin suppressor-like RCC1 family protein